LGVAVCWNHPRRPEENGVVERANGVTEGWVEPGRCADARQLRDRLVWAVQIQRAVYPAIGGRSRLEAYPQLLTPQRPYRPEDEAGLWDERRVYEFLAGQVWRRRADQVGQIWLYNRGYMTVPQCKGRDVTVRFDPQTREWVILDVRGQEVQVWHEDEARFGQQGTLTRVWARKGSRPRRVRQNGRTSLYVLTAVCAAAGAAAGLIAPELNTAVVNLFLEQLSRQLAPGVHAVLLWDGAGYHVAKGLVVPSNVSLIHLPPYSPELNPVENLWHYLCHPP